MKKKNILILMSLSIIGILSMKNQPDVLEQQVALKNDLFDVEINKRSGVISSLMQHADAFLTNFVINDKQHPEFAIADSRWVGDVITRYRLEGAGRWEEASTSRSNDVREVELDSSAKPQWVRVHYRKNSSDQKGIQNFSLTETYELNGDSLLWKLRVKNNTNKGLILGDIGLPLLFNSYYVRDQKVTYTQRVLRHHFIEGHGSYIFWTRTNGVPPFLVMTPLEGTHLEYFDQTSKGDKSNADNAVFAGKGAWEGLFTVYIHSLVQGSEIETEGTWRQPYTQLVLKPAGQSGDECTYGFKFQWAKDYDQIKDIVYQNGLIDVEVVPGMSVPQDLTVNLALRTKKKIHSIEAEYPGKTEIQNPGEIQKDLFVYKIKFAQLGENLLTIRYGSGEQTYLEFFVMESLETLIKKRAIFIARKQQWRNTGKWYDGLFSLWDMQDAVLRSPDNTGGLHDYMVGGSDDPSNCKAPYLAVKNVHFPDPQEIEAIEYHLEKFVWGGLQRTDQEHPHPYGIYGSDNWYVDRNTNTGITGQPKLEWVEKEFGGYAGTGLGKERMWRTFDYTSMFLLYYRMYQIAKLYPDLVHYLDATGYLKRAYGTARAYFEVPYSIYMPGPPLWSHKGYSDWAYKQGNFHELVLPSLIDDLYAEGMKTEAEWLKGEWEKKVKYMVYDDPYPFGSEMLFDATAFESTHAVAKYGIERNVPADTNLWQDKNTGKWYSHPAVKKEDFQKFMEDQIAANIADRGWLSKTYYHLGSDIRQGGSTSYQLSYMTQMGGWGIFDYALYYSKEPEKYMRLGYASYLGSWALVNSGVKETNYGYWFPGKENDGAAGWAFEPQKHKRPWLEKNQRRGIWSYDGEIDHGFIGAIDFAATVVVNDSLFGMYAYGGDLVEDQNEIKIIPRDGIRQRLHMLTTSPSVHLSLNRDGFAGDKPIVVSKTLDYFRFELENRTRDRHQTVLTISGLPAGKYQSLIDDAQPSVYVLKENEKLTVKLSTGDSAVYPVVIRRQS